MTPSSDIDPGASTGVAPVSVFDSSSKPEIDGCISSSNSVLP